MSKKYDDIRGVFVCRDLKPKRGAKYTVWIGNTKSKLSEDGLWMTGVAAARSRITPAIWDRIANFKLRPGEGPVRIRPFERSAERTDMIKNLADDADLSGRQGYTP